MVCREVQERIQLEAVESVPEKVYGDFPRSVPSYDSALTKEAMTKNYKFDFTKRSTSAFVATHSLLTT